MHRKASRAGSVRGVYLAAVLAPLEPEVDHVRAELGGRVILEYGDYECPYSRKAFREVQRVESRLGSEVRFAFRHFPLTEIHPHALFASAAAEAAAMQGLLFHRQKALADAHLRGYAEELGLDVDRFDADIRSAAVLARIRRDVESGLASGEVRGTPPLFIDGVVHRGPYDAGSLLEAISLT